jgi:hypothetical protein
MKYIICRLLAGIVIFFFLSSPLYAGWKEKVTSNQILASEYIQKLKSGADPARIERPHLRRIDNFRAKQARSEIIKAMEKAEKLARAGKHQLIEQPEFTFKPLSEEKYNELRDKKK